MSFVVSQGQLSAVSVASDVRMPMYTRLSDGVYADDAHLYREQPQIRTVVSFLARNIAQLGLHVFRRVSDTDRERLTDHPLSRIAGGSGGEADEVSAGRAAGVGFGAVRHGAVGEGSSGLGRAARGDSGAAVPGGDRGRQLVGARQVPGARLPGDLVLDPDQVVHFHGYSPTDLRTGSSPIEALRSMLAEEFEATRSREQMWRNGGRLSGVLKRPADAPKWDPDGEGPLPGGLARLHGPGRHADP